MNVKMTQTLHISVVQPERPNLTPFAYDLNKPVLVIATPDATIFVNIEKTRNNGKEFRHFKISIQGKEDQKSKRTSHYHKALGIALNVATGTNNHSLKE